MSHTIPSVFTQEELEEQYPFLTQDELDMNRDYDVLQVAHETAKRYGRHETAKGIRDLQEEMSRQFRELLETAKTRQYVALADGDVETIKDALSEYASGKNSSCWSVCDFGWKDADLEPHGCTGISSISRKPGGMIRVEFGGHKTIAPPEDEEGNRIDDDIEPSFYNLAFGDMAEWTGDDWSLSFSDSLDIRAIPDEHGSLNATATAEAIVNAVQASIKSHSNGWAQTEADIYGDESTNETD